jgi:hypothetical protein
VSIDEKVVNIAENLRAGMKETLQGKICLFSH